MKCKCKSYKKIREEGTSVLGKGIGFIINIMTMARDKVKVRVSV